MFLLWLLFYGIVAIVYAAIAGLTIYGFYYLFENIALNIFLGVVFGLGAYYAYLRLSLMFLLIALDEQNPLAISWNLLKGNIIRLFGLLALIGVATYAIGLIILILIAVFSWLLSSIIVASWLGSLGLAVLMVFILLMYMLSWAVTAKAYGLVYKTFTKGK